ncbi:MAG: stalk domain-containing protein [Defluviitaleaceae bacterium]|nr:stalk domain-containing protein [Defluviitaleaceae bacterium]
MRRNIIQRLTAIVLGLMMLLAIPLTPTAAHAQQPITVRVNGTAVQFTDVHPTIVNDRTLVPMRGVFEHMGFNVAWDDNTSTATLTRQGILMTVRIGDAFMTVNGQTVFPEVPPQIVHGRFMLPLRAVAEASGAIVSWDGTARAVIITYAAPDATPTEPAPPVTPPPATLTRSQITLPNRRLSDAELENWMDEYNRMQGPTALELEIFRLVNIERAAAGVPALETDIYLMMAARFKSQEMVDLGYFEHTSPVYGRFTEIPRLFGAQAAAENMFNWQGATARQLVDGWMDSPGHRANILNSRHNFIGVGVVDDMATQMFGNVASRRPDPEPTPRPGPAASLRIGRQSGTVVAGTPGRAEFSLTTRNLPGENFRATLTELDRANHLSLRRDDIRIRNNSGTLEIETTAQTRAGTWRLELNLDIGEDDRGRTIWLTQNFTLIVEEAADPEIRVGRQIGHPNRGEIGIVQFPIHTQDIPNGTYQARLMFDAGGVQGIILAPSNYIQIRNGVGTLTMEISLNLQAGRWWPRLALAIDEDDRGRPIWITSNEFELDLLHRQ